jgi:hypothetical protein
VLTEGFLYTREGAAPLRQTTKMEKYKSVLPYNKTAAYIILLYLSIVMFVLRDVITAFPHDLPSRPGFDTGT